MPKEFIDAVRRGANVITKKLPGGRYIHLAKKGGKWTAGEVKTRKKE